MGALKKVASRKEGEGGGGEVTEGELEAEKMDERGRFRETEETNLMQGRMERDV